ncbi:hypothetical protein OE88DRAFT_1280134 [Heliocybe sulcata]|uniref:Uncharacterized protein n=1 Tax=Heliocybe sulcata TaxID=5364 RepID=A0A5C3N8U2_9AGAM|nr:hypothetical protein OE88DRAFT_1280134 [Heliocybe sulcata]
MITLRLVLISDCASNLSRSLQYGAAPLAALLRHTHRSSYLYLMCCSTHACHPHSLCRTTRASHWQPALAPSMCSCGCGSTVARVDIKTSLISSFSLFCGEVEPRLLPFKVAASPVRLVGPVEATILQNF